MRMLGVTHVFLLLYSSHTKPAAAVVEVFDSKYLLKKASQVKLASNSSRTMKDEDVSYAKQKLKVNPFVSSTNVLKSNLSVTKYFTAKLSFQALGDGNNDTKMEWGR